MQLYTLDTRVLDCNFTQFVVLPDDVLVRLDTCTSRSGSQRSSIVTLIQIRAFVGLNFKSSTVIHRMENVKFLLYP